MEERRVSGIWWLSDKPENKIAGDLLIGNRKLKLNGSFDEGLKPGIYRGSPKLIRTERQTTIQGIARDNGKKYTLEYFTGTNSFKIHSYKVEMYSIGDIFIGEHINKTEDIAFNRYYIEFPYLYEWLDDSLITIHTTFKEDLLRRESTVIVVDDVKTTKIYENENIMLTLVSSVGRMPILTVEKNINIEQKCVLEIEAKKSRLPLTEARSIIKHFQRFLIIATGRSLEPVDIKVKTDSARNYTTMLPYRFQKKDYKDINIHDMNFTFKDIKTEHEALFTKWFTDKDKYADIFDLFSALHSSAPKILENQFKDIVGAIEGYVRIKQNNLDIPLDKAIKTVNEALPESNRPLARNDYNKIRITRNKLSHMAIKAADLPYVIGHEEMCFTYEKLLALFEYSVLRNFGLSQEVLSKFYNKRRSW